MSIVTHSGYFHCDEVCAYAILHYLYPKLKLYRTRNEKSIEKATYVIDVGGVYDVENGRFDHHQKDFKETFYEDGFIPMSSSGLVWKHFGIQFLKKYKNISKAQIENVYHSFYNKFILEIDAHDNGVRQCKHDSSHKYHKHTVLGSLISDMNGIDAINADEQMSNFKEAASFMLHGMQIKINSIVRKLESFKKDMKIIKSAFKKSTDKRVICVEKNCSNWLKCIHEYEKKNNAIGETLFAIYKINTEYRVRAIENERFNPRKKLRTEKYLLKNLSSSDDLIFVHKERFIGSAKTIETAREIAKLSLA